jgi:hypothetical protein
MCADSRGVFAALPHSSHCVQVYVQQRVAETADALFGLLAQGAHFYVCGDANAMAVRAKTRKTLHLSFGRIISRHCFC